jgi:hypothetical protein
MGFASVTSGFGYLFYGTFRETLTDRPARHAVGAPSFGVSITHIPDGLIASRPARMHRVKAGIPLKARWAVPNRRRAGVSGAVPSRKARPGCEGAL